ncbi:Sugar efflux transporter for intercellular exchange [Nesidiocoris tenuis]|uniref:Sugar transporter SWEET n=1 Tax=Nesidiocoris tenuis TaxID=355587 RepID=A0ABN7AZZ7_9HEMI|nr:Sugar efflux transporter for intercellular exchange [Nesidiocoris tenuis]
MRDYLKQYEGAVGASASIVTIAQFFSPVLIIKQIVQQGNTKNVDPTPFVGGIGMGLLFLRDGLMLGDGPMTIVNIVALALNAIYLLLFLSYHDDKAKVLSQFQKCTFGALAIIAYTFLDPGKERVAQIYGICITGLMFALISAPLIDLKNILRERDTRSLPFPMILSGTIVTMNWLVYGIIIDNGFMIVQNVVGLILSASQLSLFVICPLLKRMDEDKKKAL